MRKTLVYIAILCSLLFFACGQDNLSQDNLLGNDYRLFKNTPVWDLAQAVRDEKVDRIKELLNKKGVDVNYQESRYGSTLLMLSIINEQYSSFKALIEGGANVNVHDTYDGRSAIINAAAIQSDTANSANYLKLLLIHGANPNDEEVGERRIGNKQRKTPLVTACEDVISFKSPLSKVKVLVEAGANVNYKNEFNMTPLRAVVLCKHYDVLLYLINNGMDYKSVISTNEGKNYYLWDKLRFSLLPLNSEKYKQKMAVVEFLKQQGIDYRKLPIPDYAKEQAQKMYPDTWKEYLEKY